MVFSQGQKYNLLQPRAQFHKACKHKNLLSTDKSSLKQKLVYQPKLHKVYIVAAGARHNKLAKQYFPEGIWTRVFSLHLL